MITYGTANPDGSISRKSLKAGRAPADDVRLESQAQSDKLGLIADKLERLILLQAMGPQNEGLTSMVNNQTYNYVTAPATSTDDEYGGLINRIRQW